LRVRPPGARGWKETPLEPLGNDLWQAIFEADRLGVWEYTIVAWIDRLASWRWELERKAQAGQADLSSELSEGALLVGRPSLTLEEALDPDLDAGAPVTRHQERALARPLV